VDKRKEERSHDDYMTVAQFFFLQDAIDSWTIRTMIYELPEILYENN
jgi:hypothetical protein